MVEFRIFDMEEKLFLAFFIFVIKYIHMYIYI